MEPKPLKFRREAIAETREQAGLTQKELGLKMGVAQPRIRHIENIHAKSGLTIRTIEQVFEALKISSFNQLKKFFH